MFFIATLFLLLPAQLNDDIERFPHSEECIKIEKKDGTSFHFIRRGMDPDVIIEPDSNKSYATWLKWYKKYHLICGN